MGKAKNANRPLTQEEIWDDSALVQSWDEAVEEYKVRPLYLSRDSYLTQCQQLYHSIHAKGENVEDVLREAEAAEAAEDAGMEQDGQRPDEAVEAMEDDVGEVPEVSRPLVRCKRSCLSDSFQAAEEPPTATDHQPSGTKHPAETAPTGAAAMPHAALSQGSLPCIDLAPTIANFRTSVQDEGLKNLMMAWYFAGYYTGLYEGQQRASQNNSS